MRKNKKKSTMIGIVVMLIAVLCAVVAALLYFAPYAEGYQRQNEEKDIAVEYLQDLQELQSNPGTELNQIETEDGSAESTSMDQVIESESTVAEKWSDDTYYERDGVTYTPEYAAGVIDCVLIIPEIQMCRGVYTGTWSDIVHNLDVWMATTARPDYVLGETHYCIYGHNTPRLNLSFNRLQSLSEGSVFYLINSDGAYQYQVTAIFGVSRSNSTKYTDDFSIGNDKSYLITCGRDEYRYLDLIVEGTLETYISINEVSLDELFYK